MPGCRPYRAAEPLVPRDAGRGEGRRRCRGIGSDPVVYVVNLASAIAELRDAGVMVVGTAGETDRSIYDFDQRAFCLGAGAEGRRPPSAHAQTVRRARRDSDDGVG